jgi:hypothetical protein
MFWVSIELISTLSFFNLLGHQLHMQIHMQGLWWVCYTIRNGAYNTHSNVNEIITLLICDLLGDGGELAVTGTFNQW